MNSSRNVEPDRLDALAAWVGIRAATDIEGRRHQRRRLSLVLLLGATIGAGAVGLTNDIGLISVAAIMGLLLGLSLMARGKGPEHTRQTDQPTVGRKRGWSMRSALLGLAIVAVTGMSGAVAYLLLPLLDPVIASLLVAGDPLHIFIRQVVLLLYVLVLLCVVPTLVRWKMPSPLGEN